MKKLLFTLSIFIFISCSEEAEKTNKNDFSNRVNDNVDPRIDLDQMLKDSNELFEIREKKLIICCYDLLDISEIDNNIMNKNTESYYQDNDTFNIDVFTIDTSYVKYFQNDHPSVSRYDLTYGKIYNNKLISNKNVKIGMSKDELLESIFKTSDRFKKINTLKIYDNELGENWTNYHFQNDTLSFIEFDSDYDWINRKN